MYRLVFAFILGHQITFTPTKKILINSSSFAGNDKPDTAKQMRYFHNLYAKFQLHKNIDLLTGFDIGAEQKTKGSSTYNIWYTPYILFRYKLSEKFHIGLRGEYYRDKHGVIIVTNTPNGFQTYGYSINSDYHINSHVVWRIEARGFNSKDQIFTLNNKASTQNYCITSSIAVAF